MTPLGKFRSTEAMLAARRRRAAADASRTAFREAADEAPAETPPLQTPPLRLPLLPRPRTRGDCANVPRPCPFVTCRHHLYLDISPKGIAKLNDPDIEPAEMPPDQSCSLDVAEQGPQRLEAIARILRVTKERARQIEDEIFKKLRMDPVAFSLWNELDGTMKPHAPVEPSDPDSETVEVSLDLGLDDGLLDGLEWAEGGIDL